MVVINPHREGALWASKFTPGEFVTYIEMIYSKCDEVDLDTWLNLLIETVGAPEDWSGSVDMDPEDYLGEDNGDLPLGWHDPLEMLDKAD